MDDREGLTRLMRLFYRGGRSCVVEVFGVVFAMVLLFSPVWIISQEWHESIWFRLAAAMGFALVWMGLGLLVSLAFSRDDS